MSVVGDFAFYSDTVALNFVGLLEQETIQMINEVIQWANHDTLHLV